MTSGLFKQFCCGSKGHSPWARWAGVNKAHPWGAAMLPWQGRAWASSRHWGSRAWPTLQQDGQPHPTGAGRALKGFLCIHISDNVFFYWKTIKIWELQHRKVREGGHKTPCFTTVAAAGSFLWLGDRWEEFTLLSPLPWKMYPIEWEQTRWIIENHPLCIWKWYGDMLNTLY